MVVKTMIPFWIPVIIRHLKYLGYQRGIIILTTTHMAQPRESSVNHAKSVSLASEAKEVSSLSWLLLRRSPAFGNQRWLFMSAATAAATTRRPPHQLQPPLRPIGLHMVHHQHHLQQQQQQQCDTHPKNKHKMQLSVLALPAMTQ